MFDTDFSLSRLSAFARVISRYVDQPFPSSFPQPTLPVEISSGLQGPAQCHFLQKGPMITPVKQGFLSPTPVPAALLHMSLLALLILCITF